MNIGVDGWSKDDVSWEGFHTQVFTKYLLRKENLFIHSVNKLPGIDHSKSPLKKIVKNLFDINLVCSQCSTSVYLKCVSRLFQWIRISTKNWSQILHCKWNFMCGIVENVSEGLPRIDFIRNTCICVVRIQKRSIYGGRFASLWSLINFFNWCSTDGK